MRVLIAGAGSHGDVLPFIAIGREMLSRGHEVLFFGNPHFREHATTVGLEFVPIGTSGEYHRILDEIAEGDPARALKRINAYFGEICGDYYRAMKAHVAPDRTVTVSSSVFFAPRLLRETDAIPCAAVHLAPHVIRSTLRPARSAPHWIHAGSPQVAKRLAYWYVDRFVLDPCATKPLNKLRATLRLPPLARIFRSWINEADCLIGLFPDWYAERQPDWPPGIVLAGFPLYDHGDQAPLTDELEAFLAAGPAPVAFSAGTANAGAAAFFRTSLESCRILGVRAILLSGFAGQVPADLPDGVMHVRYAPFGALLPRLAAFVHHGGIGSTSQAMKAGVPQLIRPVAFDQFDNSARAVRLGVARELLPRQYSANGAADALSRLMSDEQLHQRCRDIAKRLAEHRAVTIACDAIEATLACASRPAWRPCAGRSRHADSA